MFAAGALLQQACSALLDSNASQCQHDSDCAKFGQARCEVGKHVCVPVPSLELDADIDGSSPDAVLSCRGPDGCFQCAATTEEEILDSCTDSKCVPFDNRRLSNLNHDGTLKPLP